MLGSGAVIVMDDSPLHGRDSLLRLSYFYMHESCGQCTPCREGTGWMWRVIERIYHGKGRAGGHRPAQQRRRQHPGPHHLRARATRPPCRCAPCSSISSHEFVHHDRSRPTQESSGPHKPWLRSNSTARKCLGARRQHGHACGRRSSAATSRISATTRSSASRPTAACAWWKSRRRPSPCRPAPRPVTPGMIVRTQSPKAVARPRQGVMEFLLINHPLDCPICDQGGECQLQDLAVGYGAVPRAATSEEKRVVFHKNVGPLISMEEMSRCIHCTRCVRFGQEVAGVMELGMPHRGEHSGDHHLRRTHGRQRVERQHDRPVPGRCAHQQALPLQRPHLGVVASQVASARTTRLRRQLWWCR
jgi:hypothetical protein